jgi:ribosomal protein S27AE
MPMPPYPVRCYAPGCGAPAAYKVAARWSDGQTDELKTYALTCPRCLPGLLAAARVKRAACRLAAGETLDEPGVYELSRGGRDRVLARRPELER